jgi:hypothetical protein
MNAEDATLCRQAIELANAKEKRRAYEIFYMLSYRYPEDITVLYWLAYTTPSTEEAQQAVGDIARIQPHHPKLYELQGYVDRMEQIYALQRKNPGPVLQCPYCHYTGPARIAKKVSVGGWILFVIILLSFFPLATDATRHSQFRAGSESNESSHNVSVVLVSHLESQFVSRVDDPQVTPDCRSVFRCPVRHFLFPTGWLRCRLEERIVPSFLPSDTGNDTGPQDWHFLP